MATVSRVAIGYRAEGPLHGFFWRKFQQSGDWIDRHPSLTFIGLTIFYVAAAVSLSATKLLWLDELITLHIAELSGPAAIWHALAKGVDPNPPLMDLLVMGSIRLFGEHALAARLPSILGYWVGSAALFDFLRHRMTATWAAAGVVMSMAMAAFNYSYEARSYGILYGLAMLAFLCWTYTANVFAPRKQRNIALAGMVFALAVGICANYFAVVAFLPIAGGELARTLRELRARNWRKSNIASAVQFRTWIALAVASAPLLAFNGLIRRAIAEFAPYAWNRVSLDTIADCYQEMVEVMLYPLLALLVFAIAIIILARSCPRCRAAIRPRWIGDLANQQARFTPHTLAYHEAVSVFLLMCYPILGYILARIHGGMLSPRFVIPVCFGFAIAGTITCYRIFGHMRRAGIILLLFCTLWFTTRESIIGYWYAEQKHAFYRVLNSVSHSAAAQEPIVIADPLLALTYRHYAPADLASRAVFPVDFPAVRRYRGDDSPEENLWSGRRILYGLRMVPLAELEHSASKYLIVAGNKNWLIRDLLDHRYPVQRLPIHARCNAIGGFTPLSKSKPVLFTSVGDEYLRKNSGFAVAPIPFQISANLPSARSARRRHKDLKGHPLTIDSFIKPWGKE